MRPRWSEAARGQGLCLLLTICVHCGTRVEALRSSPERPSQLKPGVQVLKIQKTGTSSLSEVVRALCPSDHICRSETHMDWIEATKNGTYKGPVVTLLRDPVERALSEFFYLRDGDGVASSKQPQWDFHNNTWLGRIRDEDLSKALDAFTTGYPKNPSRNRQALYILGFRDKSHPLREPGAVYDWDMFPAYIVDKAMRKLDNLTAFGITDCWNSSMRAIGRALHWTEAQVRRLAFDRHERNWRKAMVDRRKPDYRLLKKWLGKEIPNDTKWREVIPNKYILAIEAWSHVDIMLYKQAKKRFTEKFGEPC